MAARAVATPAVVGEYEPAAMLAGDPSRRTYRLPDLALFDPPQAQLVDDTQRSGLLEDTLAYARGLAVNCSPASMATMKRQVYSDLERALPDALAYADRLMIESFSGSDFTEGVASFIERREPRFAALER